MVHTRRSSVSRLGTAVAGLVLFAMSGMAGVEVHPLTHAGPALSSPEPSAAPPVVLAVRSVESHPASDDTSAHHGGHHGAAPGHPAAPEHAVAAGGSDEAALTANGPSHAHHGATEECTCVGDCHSGASPTPPSVGTQAVVSGEVVRARVPVRTPIVVFEDPSSYLRPLPNAPPIHA